MGTMTKAKRPRNRTALGDAMKLKTADKGDRWIGKTKDDKRAKFRGETAFWSVLGSIFVVVIAVLVLPSSRYFAGFSRGNDATSLPNSNADVLRNERFRQWFEDSGGVRKNVTIGLFPRMGRGILATADVEENDVVLHVPKRIIMCEETIMKTSPKELLPKFTKLREASDELLTAFLLTEQLKGSNSTWFPYLDILPQRTEEALKHIMTPLFYPTDEHVRALQDERMIKTALQERRRTKVAFQRFRRLFRTVLASKHVITLPQYQWARFLINSRAFSMHGSRFLVPFGDIFNGASQKIERHHQNGQHFLQYHRLEGAGMDIRADRATIRGAQVLEDYGDNDNYIYFLYHGFIMPDNAFDCASVQLPALPRDDMENRKLEILRYYGVANGPSVCIQRDGAISPQDEYTAQFFFTLYHVSDEELRICGQSASYSRCIHENPVSTSFEPNLQWTFYENAVQSQLESYPTTIEEDSLLLETEKSSPSDHHAIRFRISRKDILQASLKSLAQHKDDTSDHKSFESLKDDEQIPEQDEGDDEHKVVPRFKAWISTLGLPVNSLELEYVNNDMGYGVIATKELAVGETYLSVPVQYVMNIRSAMQSRFIRQLRHLSVQWNDQHLLLLHLVFEKYGPAARQSYWKPYLDLLPTSTRIGSPLFYAEDGGELAILDKTDLGLLVRAYRSRVHQDTTWLLKHPGLRQQQWLTHERIRWANAILDSRSIWWDGQRHLVPLLDMVNCAELGLKHKPHHTNLDPSGANAITEASWEFKAGEQVVENYGQPNYIYLLYHGFVLSENSYDCAHFRFQIDSQVGKNDVDQVRKPLIRMMEYMELFTWEPDVCVAADQQDGRELDKLLRVALIEVDPAQAIALERQWPGQIRHEHIEAAINAIKKRLANLEGHDNIGRSMVATFIRQQAQHLSHLLDKLQQQRTSFIDTQ
ncbi:hypothetical protein Poli38472_008015 [Pythium oligandrum]|uniref:SET domain-containing protein n=1 Tax=Pythium oligandrum TaxID=41045 RepID=A0A8K1CLY9_PYTOL|nr:hypothetical protein Poli38472_008015 [Pythium oligandrum]|eukprot:TMW65373.1 hypothetical protein Poli38472_008015 [Pythium oligandrum]